MRRPRVTAHAIRRYAERALCVSGLPEDDGAAVQALHDVHKIDVAELAALLRWRVARGVEAEASAVIFQGLRYLLRGETLITVLVARRRRRIERARD